MSHEFRPDWPGGRRAAHALYRRHALLLLPAYLAKPGKAILLPTTEERRRGDRRRQASGARQLLWAVCGSNIKPGCKL